MPAAFRPVPETHVELNDHGEIEIRQLGAATADDQIVTIPTDRWQAVVKLVRELTNGA